MLRGTNVVQMHSINKFTQQNLPACKPVLTPAWVILTFLLIGTIFIPIGLVSLHASRSVVEIVDRYDIDCVPEQFKSNKLGYIKDSSYPKNCSRTLKVILTFLLIGTIFIPIGLVSLHASRSVVEIVDRYDIDCVPEQFKSNKLGYIKDSSYPKNCSRTLKVNRYMKAPIYIYYQLDNYYQNHRRYVKSRSDQQLLHGLGSNKTSLCKPEQSNNGLPVVPCGLVAWSLFNDTYKFIRGKSELNVNRKNIAWKSDRDHKFGKHVYPFNFQNGTLIGGGKLNSSVPLSDQEDLIVWMRTAALPSFRKLYGRIEENLHADDVIVVNLMNNYNTYSFGGKKKLVLSTSSWLGGKNDFPGFAYIFVGSYCIVIAIVFMLLHVKKSR
ncbi:putative ala-interacting subunit 2 [Quercus suber]|uniref:ALA-interacting subunit n=1 Tax=Quercus suber TaxID=58331 RepID=A0AAW0JLQ0_QUESU